MTVNGFEKQRENAEADLPLPRLTPLRETWCSQQQVDAACDFLSRQKPEMIRQFVQHEDAERLSEYFDFAYEILDTLAEGGVDVPPTQLGKIDLMCELSRRICQAYGLPEFPPRGQPLAAGPDQPLPPLAKLNIDPGGASRGNFTQEMADSVLAKAYADRPDLWYLLAEEHRHDMRLFAGDEMRALLGRDAQQSFPDKWNDWTPNELFIEALRRIDKMCGIDE